MRIKSTLLSRKGVIGTALIAFGVTFGHALDLYDRAETLYKWFKELPTVIAALQYWYIVDPLLMAVGLALIAWSNREVKCRPDPFTLQTAEQQIAVLRGELKTADLGRVLPDVDRRVRVIAGVVQKVGPTAIWVSDVTSLIAETDQLRGQLSDICQSYSGHEAAQHPLSLGWRPLAHAPIPDEATREGLIWSHCLKRHVERCQQLSVDVQIQIMLGETAQLHALVTGGAGRT